MLVVCIKLHLINGVSPSFPALGMQIFLHDVLLFSGRQLHVDLSRRPVFAHVGFRGDLLGEQWRQMAGLVWVGYVHVTIYFILLILIEE